MYVLCNRMRYRPSPSTLMLTNYPFMSSFQYPLAFALSFSRWMCMHPWIYRLQATMNLSELTLSGELITKGTRVLVSVGG